MNSQMAGTLFATFCVIAAAAMLDKPAASASGEEAAAEVVAARPVAIASDGCEEGGAPAREQASFGYGTMTAALSGGKLLAGGDGELFLAVDLDVAEREVDSRQALNVAIVIDRSGSMRGEPIERAKEAALGIVSRLSAADRVALVQYHQDAQVVVPSTAMDDAGKARLFRAIRGVTPAGNTNLHGGMMLGREEVQRGLVSGAVNRVILLSDGKANAGVTDPRAIGRDAQLAADQGVRITAVGLGIDYNEDLMEAIAEAGLGNYYYVRDAGALAAVFAGELDNLQATVATRAELVLEPICDGVEIGEVFGYEARRDGRSVAIPLADIAGGDARKLVVKLRAPVGQTGGQNLVRARLSFVDARSGGELRASVALGIDVTRDAAQVRAAVDKSVVAQVVQVESAQAMREAAQAFDRGDVAAATETLRRGRVRAEKQAAAFDLEAAEAEPALDNLGRMADDVGRYAPGSAEGRAAVKGSKQNARALSKERHN